MEVSLVKNTPTPWPQVFLCVSITTMATLLLELALTRIFSVVFYYHFAFLAISIALFGLGLGGVFSYVVATWKAPLFTRLGRLSVVNSLLVIVALTVLLAQGDNLSNWDLALVYLPTALPFFAPAVPLAAAAAIWHSLAGSVRGRAGSVALALALVAFLVFNHKHPVLTI